MVSRQRKSLDPTTGNFRVAANKPVGIIGSRSFRVSHGLWGSCSGCTGRRRRENRDEGSADNSQPAARPFGATESAVTCQIVEHVVQKLPGSVRFLVQVEDVLGQRVSCRKNSIDLKLRERNSKPSAEIRQANTTPIR